MAYGGSETVFQKVTLKSWLYTQIESGKYRGLRWRNPDLMIFELPWVKETDPHSEDYYKLFHDWSQRNNDTGTPCESSKAKRNFRSVLTHSKHFQQIDKVDQQTGSYKVYQFILSQQEMAEMRMVKQSNISDNAYQNVVSPFLHANDMCYPSFSMYANQQPVGNRFQSAGMNDLNIANQVYREPVPIGHEMNIVADESMSYTTLVPASRSKVNNESVSYQNGACGDVDMTSIPSFDSDRVTSITLKGLEEFGIKREDLASCEYIIEYMGRCQKVGHLTNMETNSKFLYGSLEHAKLVEDVNLRKRSPYHTDQFCLLGNPILNDSKRLMMILESMDTGISIWFNVEDLSIKVVRHCLTQVFSFDIVGSNDSLTLLERDRQYTIFSFHQFLSNRNSSVVAEVTPPDPKVELIAGVEPEEKGILSKGVKIILKPLGALKLLNRDDLSSLQEPRLSLDSSSLDKQVREMSLTMQLHR